jgi:putative phage-type endonuclease
MTSAVPALLAAPPSRASFIVEPPLEPGSQAWHDFRRRTGIGASEMGAVLGLSRYSTPTEVYLEKKGLLPPRVEVDDGPMYFGRLLEPVVLDVYAQRTGRAVFKPKTAFRSVEHRWMFANLDGVVVDDSRRIVEVKTAYSKEDWGEPGSDDVPPVYMVQVQQQLRVMGADVADLAVLFHGSEFAIYTVEADPALQDMIIEAGSEFWQRVIDSDPPPITSVEDARLRWGSLSSKGNVVANTAALYALRTLRDATEHRKNLEGVEAEAKAYLMGVLGDAGDTLVDGQGKTLATWKLAKAPERFDTKTFALDHPGLHADYLRSGTPARVFLLKPERPEP